MKKVIAIICLFVTINASSQNLDDVSVSVTLRAQDWAWAIGKYGAGTDSASRAHVRTLRAAMVAANPQGWTTNVTINNVSGHVVVAIYNMFCSAPFGEVLNMGATTAERTTIYTNIRAINNATLSYYIGRTDGQYSNLFIQRRNDGKAILLDN